MMVRMLLMLVLVGVPAGCAAQPDLGEVLAPLPEPRPFFSRVYLTDAAPYAFAASVCREHPALMARVLSRIEQARSMEDPEVARLVGVAAYLATPESERVFRQLAYREDPGFQCAFLQREFYLQRPLSAEECWALVESKDPNLASLALDHAGRFRSLPAEFFAKAANHPDPLVRRSAFTACPGDALLARAVARLRAAEAPFSGDCCDGPVRFLWDYDEVCYVPPDTKAERDLILATHAKLQRIRENCARAEAVKPRGE